MCGIFGYIGPRNPAKVCLKGLKQLEYRGYDSAGLAGILEGKIFACKEVGKIFSLRICPAEAAPPPRFGDCPHPLGNSWQAL